MATNKERKSKTRVKTNQKLYKDAIITESYATHLGIIILLIISIIINLFTAYHFITYNHSKIKEKIVTKEKEVVPENILFLGDSITEFYDLDKYYPENKIVNSGISGNQTSDILNDMKNRVYRYNPSKIFILIGTNDLNQGKSIDEIVENTKKIIEEIKANRNLAKIYVESIYPVNPTPKHNLAENRTNEDIEQINTKLKEYCTKENISYIDTNSDLKDEEGNLSKDYTRDGLHLNEKGYEIVTEILKKYL